MAERIINVQDLADPEVMLEVKRTRLMELGVRWPDQASLTLAGVAGSTEGLGGLKVADLHRTNGDNINLGIGGVTLNANKTDSDSNILAKQRYADWHFTYPHDLVLTPPDAAGGAPGLKPKGAN